MRPMTSLAVVIKGPVAMAGSTPLLLRMMGTKVPINAAMMITPIIDPATVRLMTRSCWMIMPKSMRIKLCWWLKHKDSKR